MRRLCAVLLLAASTALSQKVSVGLKGGVPLTDTLKVTDRSRYVSDKAPSVIGPAVEVHLPLGLSLEADVLYRRLRYSSVAPAGTTRTTGQVWELPLLARCRAPAGVFWAPFVSAGFSFRRLAHFKQATPQPQELTGRNGAGPTIGGGMEVKIARIRISAEMRYTRWGSSSFKSALGGLSSQLNQADIMLGIMY